MYRDNNSYRDFANEHNYEFNRETESDFEMENVQDETGFDTESGSEYEMSPQFEMEGDSEYENDFEGDRQLEGNEEFESPQDEMEAELELVTTEQEFENWVNEIVVRDHRRLAPVLRTPIGKKAIRQFSKIAFRTLPFIGRKRWGTSPTRNPYYRNRNLWSNRYQNPWYYRRRRGPYNPYWRSNVDMPSQPFQDTAPSQQQDTGTTQQPQQPQGYQDGSFKNFILDTLKSLSQQIAAGNESVAALKNSMVNSAANNYPAILQPKGGPDQPGQDNKNPAMPEAPPSNELEMEDYEYNLEAEGEVTDNEGTFEEVTEMELASELLSINNEMELDHFFGKLFKKALGSISDILNTPAGKALKGLLKSVAKKALPIAGTAAGAYFGGPLGAQVGGKIGSAASGMFELELEGLSNEDREFEVAKAIVRLSGNAAKQVIDHRTGDPRDDARHALIQAATRYAPGLVIRRDPQFYNDNNNAYSGQHGGRWYRKGTKIIIENAF